MRKPNKKTCIPAALIIITIAVGSYIFYNSFQLSEFSNARSDYIIKIISPILDPHGKISASVWNNAVRKAAHMFEYACSEYVWDLLHLIFHQKKEEHIYACLFSFPFLRQQPTNTYRAFAEEQVLLKIF